jgi:RNA polymerase sigma factor (sigma-70 family)
MAGGEEASDAEGSMGTQARHRAATGVVAVSRIPPFQLLLERHRDSVYRFLLVAVGPDGVDDCFQETFLSALRAYPRLRDAEHLDRWILRIASRKAIDHHRSARRRPLPVPDVPDGPGDQAVSSGIDPADPLWSTVRSLPAKQRVAVVHRHVLDRSYAEIAELMDMSEDAVRANVHQGMKRLRETIV